MSNKDNIRAEIEKNKTPIQSDNPQVEITRIKVEAIERLANDNNDVFSQLTKSSMLDETLEYARALTFAYKPLPMLEERLARRGITNKRQVSIDGVVEIIDEPIHIEIKVAKKFLKEFLVRRHSLNRKRVEEYIKALDTTNSKTIDPSVQPQNRILSRLG